MINLSRVPENPILVPNTDLEWEHDGTFNGCVVYANGFYHMVYRALSLQKKQAGASMRVSSVGYAKSEDGINFSEHKLILSPTEDFEIYGCEDPRITYMDGKFYIFYTALSTYPFKPFGIKLAVAITKDFITFEKHPVTTFNSKAMALFPEKINGKFITILTMHTDLPPAKLAIAEFEKEEDFWSPAYWNSWYENSNNHVLSLLKDIRDQVELGAPPIKTEKGWLVIYSYIKNYMSGNDKVFGIEAALLDLENPRKILARSDGPIMTPQEEYELKGDVPNIVFPSGALIKDDKLYLYYGAADTRCALATCDLNQLLDELITTNEKVDPPKISDDTKRFARYEGNPIISPRLELDWQKMATFNPAAIYLDGKVHILYRAQSQDGTSTIGYASSKDGLNIDENLDSPVYVPREDFEKKTHPEGNSGCEDPRITLIDDKLLMTYTAYDGKNPPRVALTSIKKDDFLNKNWNWEKPRLISPPGVDDKDACIIKNIKGEGYFAFHRLGDVIWLDHLRDLDFPERKFLSGGIMVQARKDYWDNVKVGISSPPLETERGWLLIYHGVSDPGFVYKIGAMLLDYNDPKNILARTDEPIFEPEKPYELEGLVPNVVFPCGSVIIDDTVYIYYGGADTVAGVATMPLNALFNSLSSK